MPTTIHSIEEALQYDIDLRTLDVIPLNKIKEKFKRVGRLLELYINIVTDKFAFCCRMIAPISARNFSYITFLLYFGTTTT